MVVGRYIYDANSFESPLATEELILNEDGTFVQRYSPVTGHTEIYHGRWVLLESENRIHFTSLGTWNADHDHIGSPYDPARPRSYDLPLSMYGDAVHIELDTDLGTSFKQLAPDVNSK
jgi:hypothetical protein